MSLNETCTFEYQLIVRSDGLQLGSLGYSIFTLVMIVFSLPGWYIRRKSRRLLNRGGYFAFLTSCGLVFVLLGGPIWRYNPDYLQGSCVWENFFYFIGLPTMFWPLLVRLMLWANKIKLNYAIAGAVATTGLSRLKVNSPELKRKVFRASYEYGLILCGTVLVSYYAGALLVLEYGICPNCESFGLYSIVIFMSTAVVFFSIAIYLLYAYREAPDTLYIVRETIASLVAAGGLGVLGFLLSYFDAAGFLAEDVVRFDWILLVDVGFIIAWMFSVPYQVVMSFWGNHVDKSPSSKLQLKDILKTDRGRKIFELFLATDLSVENMLFYNAVTAWKDKYKPGGEATLREAERIVEKYLSKSSYLEINVGLNLRQAVRDQVVAAKEQDDQVLPETLFDGLASEVFRLMAENSVERFRESDFYRLFLGEITPDMIPWLQFTGVSFYTMFRKSDRDSVLSLSTLRGEGGEGATTSSLTGWMNKSSRKKNSPMGEKSVSI